MSIAQREPHPRHPMTAGTLDLRANISDLTPEQLGTQIAFLLDLPYGMRHLGCDRLADVLTDLHRRASEQYGGRAA